MTTVTYTGDASEIEQAVSQGAAKDFVESVLSNGLWMARKQLVEQAKVAKISRNALDETLQTLEKVDKIERENRKPESGPGGKSAFYRWVMNKPRQLSLVPDPETEE